MCEMNNVEMNYFCALFSVPAGQLTTVLLGDLNGSDMNHSLGAFRLSLTGFQLFHSKITVLDSFFK